ncbi:hypothetical protein C0583_05625 [Candidatus Parcubacteria bacterium]|nr:MAG: hypothetical protein C0583_05625 [Candidatus Parcubacteria bacterium]
MDYKINIFIIKKILATKLFKVSDNNRNVKRIETLLNTRPRLKPSSKDQRLGINDALLDEIDSVYCANFKNRR